VGRRSVAEKEGGTGGNAGTMEVGKMKGLTRCHISSNGEKERKKTGQRPELNPRRNCAGCEAQEEKILGKEECKEKIKLN